MPSQLPQSRPSRCWEANGLRPTGPVRIGSDSIKNEYFEPSPEVQGGCFETEEEGGRGGDELASEWVDVWEDVAVEAPK